MIVGGIYACMKLVWKANIDTTEHHQTVFFALAFNVAFAFYEMGKSNNKITPEPEFSWRTVVYNLGSGILMKISLRTA